jgi:hypothetical protein
MTREKVTKRFTLLGYGVCADAVVVGLLVFNFRRSR